MNPPVPVSSVTVLRRLCALVTLSLVSWAGSTHAQTYTWDGGGGDDLFGTGANWVGDAAPSVGSGVVLQFDGSLRLGPVNNYSTGDNFGEWHLLNTAGGDFTITGNGFGLYTKIENDAGSGRLFTINTDGIYARDGSLELNPVGGGLTIGGSIELDNNAQLDVWDGNSGNTLTLNGALSNGNGSGGNGSLVLNQTATVILGADNDYGATTINSGTTLRVGAGGSTGTLGGGNTANNGALIFNRTGTYTYSGVISGSGSITNEGGGTVTLSGANTYSGGATIKAGTLKLGIASGLGTAASATVAAGGTLDVAGFSPTNAIFVSGTGNGSNPALWNSAATTAASISSLTLNNDATVGNNSTDASYPLTLSSLNLNSKKLSIGVGAVSLGIRNIPSGDIDINSGGTLYSQSGGSLTSVSGTITVNTGGKMETRDTDNTAMTSVHTIALNGGQLGTATINNNNGGGAGTLIKNPVTVDSVNGGTLNGNNTGFGVYLRLTGSLSGSGALTLTGGKGVEFQGDVSGYTGTATANSGTVSFNGNADQTFNGILAGTRPLAKSGSKILTMTSNNTYSGATTVNAGALIGVTGGSCANSAVTVANTATNGVQVLTTGGQWTCAALTCGASSADLTFMNFDFGSTAPSTTTAPLQVNGNLALNASVGIIVRGSGFAATGTYPLVKYNGTLSGTVPTAAWSLPNGMVASISNNTGAKTIDLVVTSLSSLTSIWSVNSGTWDINTTANWTNAAGSPVNFLEGNSVVFNNPGSASTITLNTTVNPAAISGGVTFNNTSSAYALTGSGAIAGAVGITKSGSGELTLGTANAYSGGTLLNAGTLRAASSDTALGTGTVTVFGSSTIATASGGGARTLANSIVINAGQTLSLDGGYANLTLSGGISGSGSVNKVSSGTVTFSTQKTYTGGTTISAGILDLTGGGGSSGTIRGTVTVNPGATLRLSTGDATGYGGGSSALTTINLPGSTLHVNTTANQTLGSAVINLTGGAITGVAGANLDFYGGSSALNTLATNLTSTISGTKINLRQNNGVNFTVAAGTTASGVDLDVATVISHTTGSTANRLTKLGTGTLRLSGTNTYAVPTFLSAGKLIGVTGGSCAGSTVTVSNATTLGVQVKTTGGQWTCAGLTNVATGTLEFDFFAAAPSATTAPLQVNGDVVNNGTLNVSIIGNVIAAGTYPLVKYTGTLTAGTLGTVSLPGGAATLVNNTVNKSIDLNVTVPNQITWQGNTGNWDINSTANWTNAVGTAVKYLDGSAVVLDDTSPGAGPFTVTLSSAVRPGNVIINNTSKTYTIAGSAGILGSTALTKSGAGTLTLGVNTNSYSGGTTVNGGTISLGTGGTGSDTSTANALGLGAVTVNTGGTVKFWIQNTKTFYLTNPFTVNGGTLRGEDGNYRLIGGVMVGSSGANFQTVWGGKNLHFDSPIAGTGSLRFSGTEFYFNAANTYSGPTTISSGSLNVGSTSQLGGGSYSGLITNNGSLIYNGSSAQTLSGVISGTGTLIKSNTSTLTLSGANTYTGTTTVAGGTLEAQNNANGVGKGYTVAAGATLRIGYSTSTSWGGGNSVVVNGNGVADASGLYLKGGQTMQFGSTLTLQTAPSTVRAYGTGSPTLNGGDVNNTHLSVASTASGSVIDSAVKIACVSYGYRMNVASGANTASGDLVVNGVISGSGSVNWGGAANNLIKYGAGSVKLTAANTYSAGVWVENGSLILSGGANRLPAGSTVSLGDGTGSSSLVLDGVSQTLAGINTYGTGPANAVVGGSATPSILTINNSAAVSFAGAIGGAGANQNNLSLVKAGSGSLALSGNLTYTGNTTVSAGSLSVGTLSVPDGATLSVVDAGGAFKATSLTLGSSTGCALAFTGFASATAAPVMVTNLTVNGAVTVTLAGAFSSGQFPLIQFTSGTLGGTGSLAVQQTGLPRGVSASLVTNLPNSTIDVVLTASPLVWVGATNGVDVATWDNGITTNWSLLGSPDYFTNNDNVQIDDTAAGSTTLNLTESVSPIALLVTNDAKNFTITAGGNAALSGGMILAKRGAGTLTLASSNNFTGGVSFEAGVINLQNGYALNPNPVTVNAGTELQLQGGISVPATTPLTLKSTGTADTGGLRNVSGNNTYGGAITLLDSATRINSDSGTLTLTNGVSAGANPVTLGGAGNIAVSTVTISGTGGLVKDGPGTNIWNLNPNITSGGVTVSAGTLQINNGNFAGTFSPTISVQAGATLLGNGTHSTGGGASLVLSNATWLMNGEDYKQNLTLKDSVVSPGPNPVSAGGEIRVGYAGGSGSYTWNVSDSVVGSVVNSKVNTIGSGVTLNWNVQRGAADSDLTLNGVIANSGNLVFAGDGITTLTAANTYTGTTVISNGTLRVNGSLASASAVTVVGGTLSGTGTVGGAVTVEPAGTLAPGASIGTLTLGNSPVLNGTIVAEINQTNAQTADLLVLSSGTLTYGGNLIVTNLGPAVTSGTFTLFNASGGYAGAFTSLTLPVGGAAHWKTNNLVVDGTITFTNAAPMAQDLVAGVAQGGTMTLPILGGKYAPVDPEGDALTVTAVGTPTSGSASFTSSNVIYVASGTTGTNTFTYTVTDALGATATRTVTVLVSNPQGFNQLSATFGSGNAYLSYLGIPGLNYALEVTHELPATNWTAVVTNTAAPNGLLNFTNPVSLSPTNDYYRTRHIP